MKGFEDPYKSEGIVQFKVEKLREFAQGKSRGQSDTIYIRGLPWKIIATTLENDLDKQVEELKKQRFFGYFLECSPKNEGPVWRCTCSATLKVLAQKEGKEDYVRKFSDVFNAKNKSWGYSGYMTFEALMNPENGWYNEATDSIILQAHITADAPHGVNMPYDVYMGYTVRSEYSLFVEFKDDIGTNNQSITSNLTIEGKLWSFTYSPQDNTLQLGMSMHQLDYSKTIAECIFWYWNDKEIAILNKWVNTFTLSDPMHRLNIITHTRMRSSSIFVPTKDALPANKKFNVLIRLLDERTTDEVEANSLESYFGNCEGVETVTLCIRGLNSEEASFVVPKYVLTQASPVFQRMLASEMTEKASGKVEIEDTNPEEFGDFLKAISPKQEHPNPTNVFALVKLAHLYQFQSLLDRCELHLMNCVEIPLIHRFACANFFGLKKLKNHLMVSLDGTGLFKLLQQNEPYLDILKEIYKED